MPLLFVFGQASTSVLPAFERIFDQRRGELPARRILFTAQGIPGIHGLIGYVNVFAQQFRTQVALGGKPDHGTIIRQKSWPRKGLLVRWSTRRKRRIYKGLLGSATGSRQELAGRARRSAGYISFRG